MANCENLCKRGLTEPQPRSGEWLFGMLNDALHEAIVASSLGHRHNQTLQSMKLAVLLKVLEWTGLRWNQVKDLTHHYTYVHPDVAERLSDLVCTDDSPVVLMLHQLLVKPDKLGRALSSSTLTKPKNPKPSICLNSGGSAADELDAILAVDGLAVLPFPNFDVRRYLDNCRFPLNDREPMFEHNTLEDDDRRIHVDAVRRLYAHIPLRLLLESRKKKEDDRLACRLVYRAIREAFGTAGVEFVQLETCNEDLEEEEKNLVPTLVETYLRLVGPERLKRLVEKLPSEKPEKRGRKRKVQDDKTEDSKKNCSETKPAAEEATDHSE